MKRQLDQQWSKYYSEGKDYLMLPARILRKLLEGLPQSSSRHKAVDIGCGTGQVARELFHQGFDVVGVDVSMSAIRLAKSYTTINTKHLRFIQYDVEQDGIEKITDAMVDFVICKYVVAFIHDRAKLFEQIAHILNSTGRFVLITPLIGEVPEKQSSLAVDLEETKALLEKHFSVEFYREFGDGYFVCQPHSVD